MAWTGTGTATGTPGSTYIDYTDVAAKLANLADLIPSGKTASTWVNLWITEAEAEIDARLRARYTVPFTTVDAVIERISMELTVYYILRENYQQEDGQLNEWVESYRRRADKLLDQVASGEIELSVSEVTTSSESSTSETERIFSQTRYDSDGNAIDDATGTFESNW